MMKRLLIIVTLFVSLNASAQFTTTDSIRAYINRYITNSPINAFQQLRMNTVLYAMANHIDSARLGTTGAVGLDTLYFLNDTTIRYKKNGTWYNKSFPAAVTVLDDSTLLVRGDTIRVSGTTSGGGSPNTIVADDLTELKTKTPSVSYAITLAGNRQYFWDAFSSEAANDIDVVLPDGWATTGRWKLQVKGGKVTAAELGLDINETNATKIKNAFTLAVSKGWEIDITGHTITLPSTDSLVFTNPLLLSSSNKATSIIQGAKYIIPKGGMTARNITFKNFGNAVIGFTGAAGSVHYPVGGKLTLDIQDNDFIENYQDVAELTPAASSDTSGTVAKLYHSVFARNRFIRSKYASFHADVQYDGVLIEGNTWEGTGDSSNYNFTLHLGLDGAANTYKQRGLIVRGNYFRNIVHAKDPTGTFYGALLSGKGMVYEGNIHDNLTAPVYLRGDDIKASGNQFTNDTLFTKYAMIIKDGNVDASFSAYKNIIRGYYGTGIYIDSRFKTIDFDGNTIELNPYGAYVGDAGIRIIAGSSAMKLLSIKGGSITNNQTNSGTYAIMLSSTGTIDNAEIDNVRVSSKAGGISAKLITSANKLSIKNSPSLKFTTTSAAGAKIVEVDHNMMRYGTGVFNLYAKKLGYVKNNEAYPDDSTTFTSLSRLFNIEADANTNSAEYFLSNNTTDFTKLVNFIRLEDTVGTVHITSDKVINGVYAASSAYLASVSAGPLPIVRAEFDNFKNPFNAQVVTSSTNNQYIRIFIKNGQLGRQSPFAFTGTSQVYDSLLIENVDMPWQPTVSENFTYKKFIRYTEDSSYVKFNGSEFTTNPDSSVTLKNITSSSGAEDKGLIYNPSSSKFEAVKVYAKSVLDLLNTTDTIGVKVVRSFHEGYNTGGFSVRYVPGGTPDYVTSWPSKVYTGIWKRIDYNGEIEIEKIGALGTRNSQVTAATLGYTDQNLTDLFGSYFTKATTDYIDQIALNQMIKSYSVGYRSFKLEPEQEYRFKSKLEEWPYHSSNNYQHLKIVGSNSAIRSIGGRYTAFWRYPTNSTVANTLVSSKWEIRGLRFVDCDTAVAIHPSYRSIFDNNSVRTSNYGLVLRWDMSAMVTNNFFSAVDSIGLAIWRLEGVFEGNAPQSNYVELDNNNFQSTPATRHNIDIYKCNGATIRQTVFEGSNPDYNVYIDYTGGNSKEMKIENVHVENTPDSANIYFRGTTSRLYLDKWYAQTNSVFIDAGNADGTSTNPVHVYFNNIPYWGGVPSFKHSGGASWFFNNSKFIDVNDPTYWVGGTLPNNISAKFTEGFYSNAGALSSVAANVDVYSKRVFDGESIFNKYLQFPLYRDTAILSASDGRVYFAKDRAAFYGGFGGQWKRLLDSNYLHAPVKVATANSQTLTLLDVQGTYTPGAFTGLVYKGLNMQGAVSGGVMNNYFYNSSSTAGSKSRLTILSNTTGTGVGTLTIDNDGTIIQNASTADITFKSVGSGRSIIFQPGGSATKGTWKSNGLRIGDATAPTVGFEVYSSDAILMPRGTTAERPTGVPGYIRNNMDSANAMEYYDGTKWNRIAKAQAIRDTAASIKAARVYLNVLDFGVVTSSTIESTTGFRAALDSANNAGGGIVFVPEGYYVSDSLVIPAKVTLMGAGTEASYIKLKTGSTAKGMIYLKGSDYGQVKDLTIDGNRTAQTNYTDGVVISTDGAALSQFARVDRVQIYNFKGTGVRALMGAAVFEVSNCRIRSNEEYGIYNESFDNAFINNLLVFNDMGGVYNTGNNTRYIGGKIYANGRHKPNSAGFYLQGSRNQLIGVELQENYYNGLEMGPGKGNIIDVVSDMNNVKRRAVVDQFSPSKDTQDVAAVGYALKMQYADANRVKVVIASAAAEGTSKYTQYGVFIDSSSTDNVLELPEQIPMFGPDSIASGSKNTWIVQEKTLNVSSDANFTLTKDYNKVVLNSTLTANRTIALPSPNASRHKKITFVSSASGSYNWSFDQAVKTNTPTTITAIPNNSVVTLESFTNGSVGEWRITNIWLSSSPVVFPGDADYTITTGVGDLVVVYATNITAARTVTLPSAASNTNRKITIKHANDGAFNINLSANVYASPSTSVSAVGPADALVFVSNGTNWIKIN